MIPKIIHQLAPINKKEWHPIWHECRQSWVKHFNQFKHIMWDDEKIDEFVKENFKSIYPLFKGCPIQIIKLDIVRYMILYKYGGIYADMDIYCYKNFHKQLIKKTILVSGQHKTEVVQNSLMSSTKNNSFFKKAAELSIKELSKYSHKELTYSKSDMGINAELVKKISGPYFLSSIISNKDIQILSQEIYNVDPKVYNKHIITKHMLTGQWGKSVLNVINNRRLKTNLSDYEYRFQDYRYFRGIDLNNYSFYKDYNDNK